MEERRTGTVTAPPENAVTTTAHHEGMRGRAHLHLIVGPVAAGKSTFALRLSEEQRAVRMNLDEWMVELFRPERPETDVMTWYAERTARCIAQIWKLTTRLLEVGTNVVLEIGLVRRREREAFVGRIETSGCPFTIYALDAPRALRRERVQRRNREQGETFSMVVPADIFELASDLWEPLDEVECKGRDVRFFWSEDSGA